MTSSEASLADGSIYGWPAAATSSPWSVMPLRPLVETIVPILRSDADAPVLVFEDGVTMTRGELLDRAERFAAFAARVVPSREPIAVALGNRAEFFVIWLALLGTGHPMVNMNPAVRAMDAAHLLADSGSALVVGEEGNAEVLRGAMAKCPALKDVLVVSGAEPGGLDAHFHDTDRFDLLSAPPGLDETTFITYTSGTTGIPKGCTHRQGETCRYADVTGRVYGLTAADRLMNPLQFFYSDAIWMFALSLVLGKPLVSVRKFSVSRFWDVVRAHEITVFMGIGSIPNLLLKRAPAPDERDHRVRMAIQIGVPPKQHRALVDRFGFPWYDAYGLSETGLNVAMPPHLADEFVGTGAIGLAAPEVEAVLLDPDGNQLAGPAVGELAVHGPYMMTGYLNQPAETAAITHGRFLRTGDEVSRDERGIHFFRGRLKEIIRRGGENIAPFEVEAVLRLHPLIEDVAVVPVPDDLFGEEVKAYVRPISEALDFDEVVAFCAERVAAHKIPRYFEIRQGPFPRTPSQRIRKTELMIGGVHTTDRAWDRNQRGTR